MKKTILLLLVASLTLAIRTVNGNVSKYYAQVHVVKRGFISDTSYKQMLVKYRNGKRDSALLRDLAGELKIHGKVFLANEVAEEYLKALKMPLLIENIDFLSGFVSSKKATILDFFFRHRRALNGQLGNESGDQKIINAIVDSRVSPFLDSTNLNSDKLAKDLNKKYQNLGLEAFFIGHMIYGLRHPETHWSLVSKFGPTWFRKYGIKRPFVPASFYNSISWVIFENSKDNGLLLLASGMMEQGLKSDSSAFLLDTYANILYKLGRDTEALKWQKKAVDLMPDNDAIKSNYKKMQASIPTWPTAEVVNFDKTLGLSEVLETAKSSGKFVMLDFMATWCGPCKQMDKYVYSDREVGKILNEKFISVKFQTDSTSNDSEYVKSWHKNVDSLTQRYEVKGFPTIVFLSPDGKLVKKIVGAVSSAEFLKVIEEILN